MTQTEESYRNRIVFFQQQSDQLNGQIDVLSSKHFRLSVLRLLVFVATIMLAVWTWSIGEIWFLLVLLLGISLFLICIYRQWQIDKKKAHLAALRDINLNEAEVMSMGKNLYYDGEVYNEPHHLYAQDLDLFGSFSLYKILNRGKTYYGQQLLSTWLSKSSLTTHIQERQEAVKLLSQDLNFRQKVGAYLFEIKNGTFRDPLPDIEAGLNSDYSFATHGILKAYRRLLPILWAMTAILYFIYPTVGYKIALILGILNFSLSIWHHSKVSAIQSKLSGSLLKLDSYAAALDYIICYDWRDTYITTFIDGMRDNQDPEHSVTALRKLQRHMDYLDYRLHMIPATILNIGLLWDSLVIQKIFIWKNKNKNLFPEIFELIGHVEALISLASWADNHPGYKYAAISDAQPFRLSAVQIIHPLMAAHRAVPNDFDIDPGTYISIVTGSNMSGKSTLLRTIGLNMILGSAGTKISGQALSYSNVLLATYMRIKDDLEENASTFKAELDRIRQIMTLAEGDQSCFILIDEMLRGTNSKDKLRGSIAIAHKLKEEKAYAMIATHDIQLAELAHQEDHIKNYYFDIDFEDGQLIFDYKVKSGICQNFNASFLLEKMGLNLPAE